MIELTRLNGAHMVVNSDLIKYAEASPDTMLTLVNGEKLVVLESCAEVVARVAAYRSALLVEAAKLFPQGSAASMVFSAALRALTAEQAVQANDVSAGEEAAQQRRRRADY